MVAYKKKQKVLIGPSSFAEKNRSPMDLLVSAGYEAVDNPYKRKLTKSELQKLLTRDVVGIIAGLEPLDREVLEKSRLKVVSRVGVGLTNVDLSAAKELGIKICYTPDGPTEAVAELTLGAMLSLIRMVPQMDRAMHDGKWAKKIGSQLEGKTVAIIGYGRIGRRVAGLLNPFSVKLLIVDPYADFENATLEYALKCADIVTLHSGGEELLIGKKEFSLMKDGVFLLNAARGGLISEEALADAMARGKVAGAWLDVFNDEPYSGPLCKYPNVILTPHAGSYTSEARLRMETEAVENLINALQNSLVCC